MTDEKQELYSKIDRKYVLWLGLDNYYGATYIAKVDGQHVIFMDDMSGGHDMNNEVVKGQARPISAELAELLKKELG